MANTANLGLPLLQAAQAQKHITVNEALVLLDGLAQLTLQSVTVTVPPVLAADGECYGVPTGAVNSWSGREGEIAVRSNGGWVFATPLVGWKAWIGDAATTAVFDSGQWQLGAVAISPGRAASVHEIVEVDFTLTAGATNTVVAAIPAQTTVVGVTGRIMTDFTGTLTAWRLGVAGSDNRYGSGLGLGAGSWVRGLTSSPQTYYSATDLILTGENGDFAAGEIRLAVHLMRLILPAV